jgi:hypothetical protein
MLIALLAVLGVDLIVIVVVLGVVLTADAGSATSPTRSREPSVSSMARYRG